MGRVLCIGHTAYDVTMPVASYPKENSKVRIGKTVSCSGGAATNAGILLARWNYDTYLASVVGNDYYGEKIKEELLHLGIHLDYFQMSNEFDTTTSYILANQQNGSRTIIVTRNKMTEVKDVEFSITPDIIIADGEEPTLTLKALQQFPNAISILDAGNLKPNIVRLADKVKYCIASQDFAEEYSKITIDPNNMESLQKSYEYLKEAFHNEIIITLGEYGSFTKDETGYHLVPSLKVQAVDTTGSGDIYHGAFAYFINEGYSLLETMYYANITGAIAATGLGRSNSIPSLQEVLTRGKENASL